VSVRVDMRPRLLEARTRSGIDAETLLKRFPHYESWLQGQTAPTLKQLEAFAHRTHTPVGFLFLDEPPVEEVPIPDFRTIGDRAIGADQEVSADLLDVIYACQAPRRARARQSAGASWPNATSTRSCTSRSGSSTLRA
jgi:transcriptional regulator with XRE-family HTH domain